MHLGDLGRVAYHASTRFERAQAVAVAIALDRSTVERFVTPSLDGGQRAPGFRIGAPRTMRILATLGCAGLSFKVFSNAEVRTVLVEQMGAALRDATSAHVGDEPRGKGLIRKVAGRNRYTLTDLGYRTAVALTKLHQRLPVPTLDSFDSTVREALGTAPHALDQALARLDADFAATALVQICGFRWPPDDLKQNSRSMPVQDTDGYSLHTRHTIARKIPHWEASLWARLGTDLNPNVAM